jgi:hypothetical protein
MNEGVIPIHKKRGYATMIHHISISAKNPQRVAEVLAEILQGYALPFPPFPGAYIVIKDDGNGTAIEVAPEKMELVPGKTGQGVQPYINENASGYSATHAAVSVPTSEERIKEIATREGWRVETFEREDVFAVIELWVENQKLIELLPPELAKRYLNFATAKNFADVFGVELPKGHNNN